MVIIQLSEMTNQKHYQCYIYIFEVTYTTDKDILSSSNKTSSDIFALMLLSSWEGECFYFSIYVLVSVCPNPSQVIITEMKQYFKYILRDKTQIHTQNIFVKRSFFYKVL